MESGIQSKLVAELFLPIPEASHMSGRLGLECFEFSSDQQVFYKHEGVGSGECRLAQSKQTFVLQFLAVCIIGCAQLFNLKFK